MSAVVAKFDRPRFAIEYWDSEGAKWVFSKSISSEHQAKLQAEKLCEKMDADTRMVDRGER